MTGCTCTWDSKHEHVILLDQACPIHNKPGAVVPVKDLKHFASGATRSSDEIRYDLLPKEMLLRAIEGFKDGEAVHGKFNYKKGLPIQSTLNHVINHLLDYQDWLNREDRGVPSEDHIAHALAGLGILCWTEANKHDSERS